MPQFQYQAVDNNGAKFSGYLDAVDRKDASLQLKRRSLFTVQLEERQEEELVGTTGRVSRKHGWTIRKYFPIRTYDRVFFFRQMALMLRSGLTLLEALKVMQTETLKIAVRKILSDVMERIQGGSSFSEAIARHPSMFPDISVRLIESAEASGEMNVIMDRISHHLEYNSRVKKELLSSLAYPAIVILVALGVALFLVLKIIPTFATFIQRRGMAVPWAAQTLLDISAFFQKYGLIMAISTFSILTIIALSYRQKKGRWIIESVLLRIPVIGKILLVSGLAQFGYTAGLLLLSGLPLLSTFRVVSKVVTLTPLSQIFGEASKKLLAGQEVSRSIDHPLIPNTVVHMIAVGEQTGALNHVMSELGDFYEEEKKNLVQWMSMMIEPVTIFLVGGMVGFVYFSFFQVAMRMSTGR